MPPNASSPNPRVQKHRRIADNRPDEQTHSDCSKRAQTEIQTRKQAENEHSEISGADPNSQFFARLFNFKTDIKWPNAIFMIVLHLLGAYHLLTFSYVKHWKAFVWSYIMGTAGGFGVTGGVHRYWTHRSYKANIPFRIFLMICYCSAGQNSIYDWVRDHRVHHKYSETDADPHNSKRGFFFSHMGWLMMKKHPEVIRRGKEIDMSDVLADPVVAFSQKYFFQLKVLFAFVLPVLLTVYLLNESWYIAIVSQCFIRYVLSLNFTWSVNSAAHLWGNKPYDKNIAPVENKFVALVSGGEGWHNYHHVFPWDYKAAELGNYDLNLTTAIIDFFALIGWVYDRKQSSSDLVKAVIHNRGDGSHSSNKNKVAQ